MAKSTIHIKKASRQMNLSKVTGYAITTNALQILAVSSLALYSVFYDIHLTGWLARSLILSASLMVIWGAVLDIREALNARKSASQKQALEEAYEQLEELNGTLRAQRHDFMNHIQVIYTLTELEDRQAALDYMDKVYGDIQKVGRVLKTASPAVNALIAAKMADCEENGIRFTADIRTAWSDCPVPGWEMCRILGNLIDNAAEAMDDSAEKRITVRLWEDVRTWRFSVENNGKPIPENLMRDIFLSGFSTKGTGRGTGLYIVNRILEEYGGRITAGNREGVTVFEGTVPKQENPPASV